MSIKQGISVGIVTTKEEPEIRQIAVTIATSSDEMTTIFSLPKDSAKDLIRLLRAAVRRLEDE